MSSCFGIIVAGIRWPPSRLCWASEAGASPHHTSGYEAPRISLSPLTLPPGVFRCLPHRGGPNPQGITIRHPKVINLLNFEMDTKKREAPAALYITASSLLKQPDKQKTTRGPHPAGTSPPPCAPADACHPPHGSACAC